MLENLWVGVLHSVFVCVMLLDAMCCCVLFLCLSVCHCCSTRCEGEEGDRSHLPLITVQMLQAQKLFNMPATLKLDFQSAVPLACLVLF